MKIPWFKRMGIIFIPSASAGWIILSIAIVYAVYLFFDIDSRSHSASDTLRNYFFNLIIIWAVYSLIAFLTSRRGRE